MEIGQRVSHKGFDVTGTISGYDANLSVFVVALDEPLDRLGQSSLTELRAPAGALKAI